MENSKIWKGIKIGITVLLLVTVLGTLGGLLYKALKPVEDVPPVENKVVLGSAVYSKAKIEVINADGSKTAVDSLSFDNTKENYVIDERGQKVCKFIVTFEEYINVMDTDLELSMLFTSGSGVSSETCLQSTSTRKYIFLNKMAVQFYNKNSFTGVYSESFDSLSFLAVPRAYVQMLADWAGVSYAEYCELMEQNGEEAVVWAKDLQDNQFYCEFIFKDYSHSPVWNISLDNFVMSGVKSVEVVNE